MPEQDVITPEQTRLLAMDAQGLCADPARKATPVKLRKQIADMGYVQIDTINVVERAHHHILQTRFDDYDPQTLAKVIERDRSMFEHYTHDASIIPIEHFPHWKHRFRRYDQRLRDPKGKAWTYLGTDPQRKLDHVYERIAEDGPLMSKDFEHNHERLPGGWGGTKVIRLALEFSWRAGLIGITRRENFQKVYDLMERIYPDHHATDEPDSEDTNDWACRFGLERLGAATAKEIRDFTYNPYLPTSTGLDVVKTWCADRVEAGELVVLKQATADGSKPVDVFAFADWKKRLRRAKAPTDRMRLLSPFEPIIHDRRRTQRLFGFEYTVECFVPEKKRKYGYFVMPLLEGDRIVGRVDPKLHRDKGLLEIKNVWWEDGVKPTKQRKKALKDAVAHFTRQLAADNFTLPLQ